MAFGWLSVLQLVPWGDVIANAPKVAEAAKKLWKSTAKKPPADAPEQMHVVGDASASALQARIESAESEIASLHGQMLASSELIKALADQNTQLIKHVETSRRRLARLSLATALTLLVSIVGLLVALQRG